MTAGSVSQPNQNGTVNALTFRHMKCTPRGHSRSHEAQEEGSMCRVLTLCVGLLTFGSFWHTSTAAADPIPITSGTDCC